MHIESVAKGSGSGNFICPDSLRLRLPGFMCKSVLPEPLVSSIVMSKWNSMYSLFQRHNFCWMFVWSAFNKRV